MSSAPKQDPSSAAKTGGVPHETALDRARSFAAALDADAFERARLSLSPECVYEVRGAVLRGPDAILASYEEATRSAHAQFDEVRYESEVVATENGARVHYTDILRLGAREHRHRCVQHLTLGPDGRISKIVHEDLPGEREAVRAFIEASAHKR